MELITYLWNNLFFQPMLNLLIFLASVLGGNFGITVIIFTMMVRLLTFPLFLQQINSSRSQQRLQPLLNEAKKKYGSTSKEYQQEVQRIYAENGVNPFSGCLTSFIQFPIWIGLYNAVIQALGDQPDQLLNLSAYLYNVPQILRSVPFENQFLWLNLTHPDPFYILPIAVAASGWLQTRLMPMPTDPQAAQTAQAMQFMPLMFGFFTLQVPSGLALYWVTSNIINIIMQYVTTRYGPYKQVPAPGANIIPGKATAVASSSDKTNDRANATGKQAGKAAKVPANVEAANGKGEPVEDGSGEQQAVITPASGANGTANGSQNGRRPGQPRKVVRPRRRSS